MRHPLSALAGMFVAAALILSTGVGPATAIELYGSQCPLTDGTVQFPPIRSDAFTQPIGEQTLFPWRSTAWATIFVDDRDLTDLDSDWITGGLWLYLESGRQPWLQRGGDQVLFTIVNPNVPFVAPIPVLPPNPGGAPVLPNGLTLFPEGFGGGSLSEAAGFHDGCFELFADILVL